VPAILDTYEKARFELWWHKKLYEGGWAGAHWPREYGGRGLTAEQQRIYQEEMARAKAPLIRAAAGARLPAPGRGFPDRLPKPGGRRAGRDVEMHQLAARVRDEQQHGRKRQD
jgi:alkylation response protein AidB-like acyl-CoA dehydrogenase